MRILVTGAAGFIGAALCHKLLAQGDEVTGLDNLSPYYDVRLKEARLERLHGHAAFRFERADLADQVQTARAFETADPERVVNLAAQAGVRYSLENPHAYIDANVVGFLNVLEECRRRAVAHLVYASTSSVYGGNTKLPFSVHDNVDHPVSLYAATKKANELMAHTYSHLHGLPTTGLRFFTVYGPWGRPDMALFKFTRNILAGRPIQVFNYGRHSRDFTYVDDIVEGVARVVARVPQPDPAWRGDAPDPATSSAPYRLYNIGNNQAVALTTLIETLESCLGRTAERELLPMQPGDVPDTFADVSDLEHDLGYRPATPVAVGVQRFVDWYLGYYGDQ